MRRVALAGAASSDCGHRWDATVGDLAIEVSAGLLDAPVDSVFVAAPAAAMDAQSNIAATLVDRLGLAGKVGAVAATAGDASGAAALHAAYAHVAAGLSRVALVLGVAKVSDDSERERSRLFDTLIDQEAEAALGLSYAALAGLLADQYLSRYGAKKSVFAEVVAKNCFHAFTGGETFLSHAPTSQEIRRDIAVAAPLVRSDFAPLFDGATAVLVAEHAMARELCSAPVEVVSVANAIDLGVVSDRPDPLAFAAVANSGLRAARSAGIDSLASLAYLEVHNACSIVEVLALEALQVFGAGTTGAALKDGLGRLGSSVVVNPSGGQHGRGLAFGASGIEQAREAFLQHRGAAGKRQVESALGSVSMSISVSGLGTQSFATVYRGGHE